MIQAYTQQMKRKDEHVGHANDNGAPVRIRFVWKPQTFKYTATANSQTQTVSYKDSKHSEKSHEFLSNLYQITSQTL